MSKEERQNLQKIKEKSISYMNAKYHVKLDIEDYGYITGYSLWSYNTNNIYIKFTNGITAIYYGKSHTFADNGQSLKIITDIQDYVWNPLVDSLGSYIYTSLDHVTFNEYNDEGDYDGSYFTEYYDEDIIHYLRKEPVEVYSDLCVLTTQDQWETKIDDFQNKFYTYFQHHQHDISLTVLSQECYEKFQNGEYRFPGIDMDGCFAEIHLNNEVKRYVQNYIQLAPGIYATAYQTDFILEDGDIKFEKVMNNEEFITMLNDIYEKEKNLENEEDIEKYQWDIQTPIYKPVFSQKLKNDNASKYIVYMLCIPEEIGLSDNNRLYYYPTEANKKYHYCFSIYSDKADAEFHTLKETDYFWIGQQIKIE